MDISVLTLGCKVNKYESDAICTSLEKRGYRVFDGLEKADIYLINTCAVTSEAEKKSRQMIARARKLNPNAKILVCGCASQNNKLQFEEKGVDYVSGCGGKNFVATYIDLIAKGEKINSLEVGNGLQYEEMDFAKQTRSRAYIKIQDGCNNLLLLHYSIFARKKQVESFGLNFARSKITARVCQRNCAHRHQRD